MTHQIKVLTVEGSKMEVFVFEPEGKGPFPGLVQCMHIPVGHTGIENDEFTLKTSKRYQDNGYVVVVFYFFIGGLNLQELRSKEMNSGMIGLNTTWMRHSI